MAFGSSLAGILGGAGGGSFVGGAVVRLLLDAAQFDKGLSTSEARLHRASRTMSTVGGAMTRSITLPVVAAGAASIKMAVDFETSFTRIRANSNLSGKEIDRLRKHVLQLAGETAKSPKELADALYYLASAGLEADDVQDTLTKSAKASASGFGDVEDIAKLTATAINTYADEGLDAAEVTDTLAAAIREGTAEPKEFADALGRILSPAEKAGVAFDEILASLSSLSNVGLDVNEGVTAMRGLLLAITAPSSGAAKALKDVGLSADEMRKVLREQGLLAAMRLLEDRTGGNIDKMKEIIPNVRALSGLFGVTSQEADKVAASHKAVTNATGDLDKAFRKTTGDPGFQFQQMLVDLQVLAVELGREAIPVLMDVVKMVRDGIKSFRELPKPVQDNIVKFTLLAAALGPVLKIGGLVIGMATKLGLTLRAIPWIAVAYGVHQVATKLADLAEAGLEASNEAFRDIWLTDEQKKKFEDTGASISVIADAVRDVIDAVASSPDVIDPAAKSTDAYSERLDALARSYGLLKGPGGDFRTSLGDVAGSADQARKRVANFVKVTNDALKDWRRDTILNLGQGSEALEDLADKTEISVDDIKAALRSLIDAQINWRRNWRDVALVAGDDTEKLVNFLSQKLGIDAPQVLELLANANDKEINRILRLYKDWKGEATRTNNLVGRALGETAGAAKDVGDKLETGLNKGSDAFKKALRDAKDFAQVLRTIRRHSDLRMNVAFLGPSGDGLGMVKGGTAVGWANAAIAAVPGPQQITSAYRPGAITSSGNRSYHADPNNPAADIGGTNLSGVFDWLAGNVGAIAREIIYGRTIIKRGVKGYWPRDDHWNHVHLADQGGVFVNRSNSMGLVAIGPRVTEPVTFHGAQKIGEARGAGHSGPVFNFNERAFEGAIISSERQAEEWAVQALTRAMARRSG